MPEYMVDQLGLVIDVSGDAECREECEENGCKPLAKLPEHPKGKVYPSLLHMPGGKEMFTSLYDQDLTDKAVAWYKGSAHPVPRGLSPMAKPAASTTAPPPAIPGGLGTTPPGTPTGTP